MSGPADNDMLDEYLRGRSPVSQRYRQIEDDGVPPDLDRRVLDEARAAVRPGEAKRRSRVWMRWSAPIALAASAVLALTIVIETAVQDEKDVEVTASRPRTSSAVEAEGEIESARSPAEQAEPELRSPAAPASVRNEAAQATPPAPATDAVESRKKTDLAPSRPSEVRMQSPAPVAVSESPAFTAPQDADRMTRPSMQVNEAGSPSTVTGQAEVERDEQSATPDPQRWLENIRRLRQEGKSIEADREWDRFREAFPDYAVEDSDIARRGKE